MEYNNLNMLDMFFTEEILIKKKDYEIQKLYENREKLRKICSDNIIVCVKKDKCILGKDVFSNDKFICLICGKEINLIKKDTVVIDMSSYETDIASSQYDIEYKIYIARTEYIDIIKDNPNINKEDLQLELNKRIFSAKKEKVLEKTNN